MKDGTHAPGLQDRARRFIRTPARWWRRELHPADEGDTSTFFKTLAAAEANLEAVDVAPSAEDPAECVTDKGYH